MNTSIKIDHLSLLGDFFSALSNENFKDTHFNDELKQLIADKEKYFAKAKAENPWFTIENIEKAFSEWGKSLESSKVEKWLNAYTLEDHSNKTIGLILAGNIPLVGLHDILAAYSCGYRIKIKLSSKDEVLINYCLEALKAIDSDFESQYEIVNQLKGLDVLIATGSDNSARYFNYYFKEVKKLLRKNRTSIAIINKKVSDEELKNLGHDIFAYFGLGCRNVTKLYFEKGFDKDRFFNAIFEHQEVVNHNKYANNYDYNKAVYLMNKIELIENGFVLLKEDEGLHSPLGVLFYQEFEELDQLKVALAEKKSEIQAITSNIVDPDFISLGKAQQPELWDYADGVNTMKFLLNA